jgi:hypothetical protein
MKRPEQLLQQGIFEKLTPIMFLQNYEQFIAFQIKNETGVAGNAGKVLGGIAKSMGTMAGVTDTAFLFPRRFHMAVDTRQRTQLTDHSDIFPAITVETPSKIVFVEIKALKGDRDPLTLLSDAQLGFKTRVEAFGFEYRIIAARDVDHALEQVYALLRENRVYVEAK